MGKDFSRRKKFNTEEAKNLDGVHQPGRPRKKEAGQNTDGT